MPLVFLSEVLDRVQLPAQVELEVAVAQPQPHCTPGAELAMIASRLAEGVRDVETLLGDGAWPATLAAIGALVRRHTERREVVVEQAASLAIDQTRVPATGHRCVSGSLHVQGDLEVVARLVVCGDLRVDGALIDCGPQSQIVVLGDLHVRSLQTTGEIWVLGSLHAARYVYGHYNDNILEVAGRITAPVVLSSDHGIEAGELVVEARPPPDEGSRIDVFDLADPGHLAVLAEIVPPEAWVDGELAIEALEASAFMRGRRAPP